MRNTFSPNRLQISLVGALLVAVLTAIVVENRPAAAQTTNPATPGIIANHDNDEIQALKREIELLKGKAPDQSHAMKDVAYHFTNLWFAGQKQNWPLAKFYCDETRAHLKWAVRIIPVRKIKGGELDLRAMLDGIDQSLFVPLQNAIQVKSADEFSAAYRQTLDGCYSCHVASEKPFLRLHVPEQPEARLIDFAPAE
ncbi:hypothetical protein ACXR0O_13485 [Verrucomicrobiota bacterium sgz303538]